MVHPSNACSSIPLFMSSKNQDAPQPHKSNFPATLGHTKVAWTPPALALFAFGPIAWHKPTPRTLPTPAAYTFRGAI
jgi:hypothetical protein